MSRFIFINFLWHFPDELSVHFLFTPFLFQFLGYLQYWLSQQQQLPDKIFFGIGNIKTQTIFIFSKATFHTDQTFTYIEAFTYIPLLFFSFISFFDLIQFSYPEVRVSFPLSFLHYFTIWELYSFISTYFPSLHGKNSTFFYPNSIPISVLKTLTILTSVSIWSSLLENSFKSSMNNNCFSFYFFFSHS